MQTEIPLYPGDKKIDYTSELLLIGSCFSEHIGRKFDDFQFKNLQNPFGVLYHPVAIFRLLERAVSDTPFTSADLIQRGGKWYCLEVHSLINGVEEKAFLAMLNNRLDSLKASLKGASHLILTLGTAWGYRYHKSGAIVGNCLKIPQSEFSKELLPIAELAAAIKRTIAMLEAFNKELSLLFTVSPVRHIKDGFTENTRSKAHLIAAVHEALEASGRAAYFPSFEIMMDELRDYRFYSDDMLHPNSTALDIIWEKFCAAWIAPETSGLREKIGEIRQAMQHRAFDPESKAHKEFLRQLELKKQAVVQLLPHARF